MRKYGLSILIAVAITFCLVSLSNGSPILDDLNESEDHRMYHKSLLDDNTMFKSFN